MFHQARYDRRMPGDGVIRNADYLAALLAGLPISVEVPNSRPLAELGPLAFAKLARRTTLDLLEGMVTQAKGQDSPAGWSSLSSIAMARSSSISSACSWASRSGPKRAVISA